MADPGFLDDTLYPPGVEVIIAYLRARLSGVASRDVDTRNPTSVKGPAVRVLRVGGTDDGIDDKGRYVVVALDKTYVGAQALAVRIRKLMAGDLGYGGLNDATVPMGDGTTVWVSSCSTDVAPANTPTTNQAIDQEPGYYRVVIPSQ